MMKAQEIIMKYLSNFLESQGHLEILFRIDPLGSGHRGNATV